MMTTAEPRGQRRVWGPKRIVALGLSCLVLAAGLSAFSARAYAALVPLLSAQGAHLQLQSDPGTASFLDMSPGSVEHWQINATVVDPSASLNLQFTSDSGALVTHVNGLQVGLDRCDAPWTSVMTTPVCATGQAQVIPLGAANAIPTTSVYDLAGITSGAGKFLLVTLALPDNPTARADKTLMGIHATVGFGLTAAASSAVTPPPSTPPPTLLAFTGADIGALLLLAAGALGLGIVVVGARRLRSTIDSEEAHA